MNTKKYIYGLYVTHGSTSEMQKMIDALLNEKLIACANVFPVDAQYVWKNAIRHKNEYVSLLKTSEKKVAACVKRIEEMHPYDTPSILEYTMAANSAYYDWIEEATSE